MNSTLSAAEIAALADRVEAAQREVRAIPKLTDDFPAMTIDDGYAVQLELRRRALAAGRRQSGWKAGLTSKAKMQQMGVHVPAIGFLMADTCVPEGGAVELAPLLHPRAECEVAFVTRLELCGGDCTREQVLDATDFVMPAIEILDSRFAGFNFDLPSVIADNTSAARYVVGGRSRDARELELPTLGVVLERNGMPVAFGAAAAVLEHPADAVALLVKALHALGENLPAGSFVMSGGITEAIPVQAGDCIVARFQELGSVSVRFA